jgi:hypothetical protein
MRAAFLACLIALAGCQPTDVFEAANRGQDEPGAPMAPAPDPAPVTFPALSDATKAATGDVSLSAQPRAGRNAPPAMKLMTGTGVVFETELMPGAAEQATNVNWAMLFGSAVVVAGNPPPGAPTVDMHDVVMETVPKHATQGGFCGAEPTAFIAMATGLEIGGQKMMKIAAFKGDVWPPEGAPLVCGVFSYSPPG